VSHLIDVMPGVQAHKAGMLFNQLLEHVAATPHELIERMRSDPRLQRVLWEAARAAADTELNDKIRGLARIAAEGVLDDAALDTSQLRIRALAEMQGLHLRVLLELESAGALGPTKEAVPLTDLLDIDVALATVLCADLLRLGMIETGGISFSGTHSSARLSSYGEQMLDYLREEAGLAADR
jgi:hypothetical protein